MNNCICCECLDCGNEFVLPVPDLLEEDPEAIIGEIFWCGACDSHSYDCSWGLFSVGSSSDRVKDVMQIWGDWASSHTTK